MMYKAGNRYHMIKYPIVKSAFGEHRHRASKYIAMV